MSIRRLQEYDVVRIKGLQSAGPWKDFPLPNVGEEGTIVYVLGPGRYVVESVNADGTTKWLCDLSEPDLLLIHRPASE